MVVVSRLAICLERWGSTQNQHGGHKNIVRADLQRCLVPTYRSAAMDTELTADLLHGPCDMISQLYKALPGLWHPHQSHSYSPIWASDHRVAPSAKVFIPARNSRNSENLLGFCPILQSVRFLLRRNSQLDSGVVHYVESNVGIQDVRRPGLAETHNMATATPAAPPHTPQRQRQALGSPPVRR